MFGRGFTPTVTCAVPVHPLVVPCTVYVVDNVGDTVIGLPLTLPGFQTYVVAPLPVSVVDCPEQIVAVPAVAVTVGVGLTVTVIVSESVHPAEIVPVTVYVVVLPGETVTEVPVKLPGIQL